jgi:ribosomal protein S18 acetylase RimI-like enzyme
MGVGAKLLDVALRSITRSTYEHLTCAVDRSNTPAVRIYQRAGFRPFGERAALVKPVRAASAR